jgi:hypothetical protein
LRSNGDRWNEKQFRLNFYKLQHVLAPAETVRTRINLKPQTFFLSHQLLVANPVRLVGGNA